MTKKIAILGLAALLLTIGGAYWYMNYLGADELPQPQNPLELTGNECDVIAEKAAIGLPEALPFQKQEKAARKARVLENCMHDRAYVENSAWVKRAEPIAQIRAKTQQVSFNEAYETMRREAMYSFSSAQQEPLYWVKVR